MSQLLPSVLLFIAAAIGGTINSVAGGGSFITLPSLIFTGIAAKTANATSTVALWPGSLASIGAYRRELAKQNRSLLILTSAISLIGGVLGAILLIKTSQLAFVKLLPFLLLIATLLFTFGRNLTATLRKRLPEFSTSARLSPGVIVLVSLIMLVISVYGGYFGGGIGILILATLELIGMENIHEMNALKTLLASCINGVAVITFVIYQAVDWTPALIMLIGAIIGGYGGAYLARKMDQRLIRGFVIAVGVSMTIYFFVGSLR